MTLRCRRSSSDVVRAYCVAESLIFWINISIGHWISPSYPFNSMIVLGDGCNQSRPL